MEHLGEIYLDPDAYGNESGCGVYVDKDQYEKMQRKMLKKMMKQVPEKYWDNRLNEINDKLDKLLEAVKNGN